MTHDEARELIGAVPGEASPELLEHLKNVPRMPGLSRRDARVRCQAAPRAGVGLAEDPGRARPAGPMPKPTSARRRRVRRARRIRTVLQPAQPSPCSNKRAHALREHTRPRVFAFAASVAAALVIGSVLWLSRPPESLAAEVVTHVEGEPNSWQKTEPLPAEKLDAVLRKSGVNLGPGMPPVVYASSCWFRGHFVPHVVVTTKDGPVTVMILQHEKVNAAQQFNEDGFSGLLVPARTGSVAVLSRTPMNLEKPAADVVRALR